MASSAEKDLVYLYMFPRSGGKYYYPNVSSYCTKVEAWLRLKNIKHEIIETYQRNTKTEKLPYMKLNGEETYDSNFMIQELTKHFQLDPTEGLTAEQQAVSRAFQKMLDENTYWTYIHYRYVQKGLSEWADFSVDFTGNNPDDLCKYVKTLAWNHGIGRLSNEEIAEVGNQDYMAVSQYLADKKFFHGDNLTTIDCVIFSQLTQVTCGPLDYPQKPVLVDKCKNIVPYLTRVRDLLYPDWDQICPASPWK